MGKLKLNTLVKCEPERFSTSFCYNLQIINIIPKQTVKIMIIKNSQIFLLILLITASYSVLAQNTHEDIDSLIVGTWVWEKSVSVDRGGGSITKPIDCNCTRKIIIYESGIIEEFRNDTLISKSNYLISDYNFMNDLTQYLINSESLSGQFKVTEETFSIGPFGGCGVITHFKRLIDSEI